MNRVVRSLAYVDTGAISERALALQAGLGWDWKNSLLLNEEEGSWFWLGEVITKAELLTESQPAADRCGNCRRCIEACRLERFSKRYAQWTAKISFLNIEHRGEIPKEFHAPMGDWLLGCDICQEVCPSIGTSRKIGTTNEGARH